MVRNCRVHERAPLTVEVTLSSEHTFYSGVTNDISEGGIFVATYTPPPIGAIVRLTLTLPSYGEWPITGEVRWTRALRQTSDEFPPGCGIRFVEIPAEAIAAIRAFVAHRDPLLYEAA
jgi:uncharacterized protein (TIGR02266 family)